MASLLHVLCEVDVQLLVLAFLSDVEQSRIEQTSLMASALTPPYLTAPPYSPHLGDVSEDGLDGRVLELWP